MRKRIARTAILGGAVGSAALAALLLSVAPAFGSQAPLQIVEDVATPDVLPADMDVSQIGEGGVDSGSVVELAETTAATYWTAKDDAGNVCLIIASAGGPSAAACTPPEYFADNGNYLVLSSTLDDVYLEGYLVPDAVDEASLNGLDSLSDNLLVPETGVALDSAVPTLEGTTESGDNFELGVPTD